MEIHSTVLLIPTCLGFIILSRTFLEFVKWIYVMFFRPGKILRDYGSWALITGSTDGIGKALAFELALKGLNLVLVGRNPEKIQATSREILQRKPGIVVKGVVIDFSTCRGEDVSRIIEEETRGLDVGIVINNAGLAYPYAKFFQEVDQELMEGVMRVNIEATTWVTKGVIPGMLQRKKGAIVNIGSGSSACASSYPLYTVYAATKAYVAMLSRSIGLEYKQHGIDVQCQVPLLVATKMASIKKSSVFIPSPETYSKACIRCIGHQEQICIPYWSHAFQTWIMSLFPEPVLDWCLFKYFVGMRARGLRKDSRVRESKSRKLVLI